VNSHFEKLSEAELVKTWRHDENRRYSYIFCFGSQPVNWGQASTQRKVV
jgi:hypothetical protein